MLKEAFSPMHNVGVSFKVLGKAAKEIKGKVDRTSRGGTKVSPLLAKDTNNAHLLTEGLELPPFLEVVYSSIWDTG